jgi:hypothetical protein
MAVEHDAAARIRSLNDAMRARGPSTGESGQWLFTSGVLALGPDAVAQAIELIQGFSEFERGNDPYSEHDFGAVKVGERQVFWKIDYYDRSLTGGSPDPSDPSVTCRVLTIMLSHEY